jgi:hypothetical protein
MTLVDGKETEAREMQDEMNVILVALPRQQLFSSSWQRN